MKSMTGREVIDWLEKIAILEWYKYHSLSTSEQFQYAPRIVWRFKKDSLSFGIKDFELFINEAVEDFKGNVCWLVSYNGKNWALVPTLIHELQESGKFQVDTQIVLEIATENPKYAIMANNDVPLLAEHLSNKWKEKCSSQGRSTTV